MPPIRARRSGSDWERKKEHASFRFRYNRQRSMLHLIPYLIKYAATGLGTNIASTSPLWSAAKRLSVPVW